ncbi:MAG: family 88 glycosyl hydrolase [Blastocatellia bacterium]|nr:MAG: family 88 glycosyl hydrolase [Blastocatellia bacterium]
MINRQVTSLILSVAFTFVATIQLPPTTHATNAAKPIDSKNGTDWSVAVVESTLKRYPTEKELASWGYAKALYLYGEYLVYKRTHDPRYLKHIKDWIDAHVDANGVVTSANNQGVVNEIKYDSLDSMMPGNLMLLMYEETKDTKYKLAADRIRKRFDTYPRTKDGGFWHATGKSREWQLWGDGVFMSMPFLVRYGNIFGDSKYGNDEAARQLVVYASHLNDPKSGLMFHAYDESGQTEWSKREGNHSPEIWCRAMGWFGMTLINVLEFLPLNHPQRPALIAQLQQLVKAWSNYQDKKTGLWYQVVDKGDNPLNWLETSSSSMYTYVIAMAVQNGYVDKKFASVAEKGRQGVLTKISLGSDGMTNLIDICEGTNVADLTYYFGRKRVTNDFHGLGAFLIMNEKFMNKSLKGVSRPLFEPVQ